MPSEHYLTDHKAAEYLGMSVQPCVVSVARGTDQSPSRERPLTVHLGHTITYAECPVLWPKV